MTEYIDNITAGNPVTVTTDEQIISGDVSAVDEKEGVFVIEARTSDDTWKVEHVSGDLLSTDDTGDWPAYRLETEEGFVDVNDVRHGFYSTGVNPKLEQDDLGTNRF